MDNILKSIPSNLKKNFNKVEIKNKLTFGDINIKNLKLKSNFNHVIFDNLHGSNINIQPITINGLFNIFQFNNYNKDFSFNVNHFHNIKPNNKITDDLYQDLKNLEKQMENYDTGLNIKSYKNLILEDFEVDSTNKGEQIIYFKNCVINKTLTLNCSGRCLIILDNTVVTNVLRFNLMVKQTPKTIILTEKSRREAYEQTSSNVEPFSTPNNQPKSNNYTSIIFGIALVICVSGFLMLDNKSKPLKDM